MLTSGFTEDEVTGAKQEWQEEQTRRRQREAFLMVQFSNRALAGQTLAGVASFERRVAGLTPAAVNSAMRRYLDPGKFSTVEAGDFAGHPPKEIPVKP